MGQAEHDPGAKDKKAWNAGRKPGAKRALEPKEVWAIRFWLDHKGRCRDRAMFDLASTANCEAVTSSRSRSVISSWAAECGLALQWSSARRGGPV